MDSLHHAKPTIRDADEPSSKSSSQSEGGQIHYALIDYPDQYVQPLIMHALQSAGTMQFSFITSLSQMRSPADPVLQFTGYESLDFEHSMQHPKTSLVCAYVIRKALIRKHYLSHTVSTWLVKHPDSILSSHFKPCVHFELDYAEFLDDALVDAWDLKESLTRNEGAEASQKDWWILKPGMSDAGNGIRLFSSMEELQAIFEEWEDGEAASDSVVPEEDATTSADDTASERLDNAMTSQLRHFIAQPYIDPPFLIESYGNRKFHIRTYVLAVGALRVYVYKEMLALFAAQPYQPGFRTAGSENVDLAQHLTNTCFQAESTRASSVRRFWALNVPGLRPDWQTTIFDQICEVTGEVFEAAAREQMVHFQTLPNAFELFGVDFLVDNDTNVWLLELNAYPDFRQTGQELQDVVVGGLFEEVAKIAVSPFFSHQQQRSDRMPLVRSIDLGRA